MLNWVFNGKGLRSLLLLLIFPLCILIFNCQGQTTIQKLSADVFEKKIATTPDKIVLDVRTPGEFAKGHIPEAMLIDYYSRTFRSELDKLDHSKPVFVYCASGGRSSSAARILAELGFREVYDLRGGFDAWTKAGKPVTR
jgi:rhodanese-related sulfurtransferase